jgi:hypothetical protein
VISAFQKALNLFWSQIVPDLHSLAITGPASWEQVADGFEELGKNEKIVFKRDQILKEFEVISDMNHLLKRLVSSGGFLLEGVIRKGA